ncbi:MAG TPA: DNA integrity scanning diadenylate cyclase DisA [Nitriliruptorales bacterium]|nr:DNA integrity scanning diadenylate cyclase DisA [Nitriliruptorales bacterium]
MQHERRRDDAYRAVVAKLSPGTVLREGVQRIIASHRGALIVIGMNSAVEPVISGGIAVDIKCTAQRLSEIAKMDGAIILSDDGDRILRANVHLVPNHNVPTDETGTRHRTAERVAKQCRVPVISVSESMRIVTLYLDHGKLVLEEVSSLLFRANQALATLERYRARLDEGSASLSALEIEDNATVRDVVQVLQRAEMVVRIAEEIEEYIVELGSEGRLIQLQLDELMAQVEDERALVVQDYLADRRHKLESVLEELSSLDTEELLDLERIASALRYEPDELDRPVAARGYRLMAKIPRLPDPVIEKLIKRFHNLQGVMGASLEDLDEVEGVGETRARSIKDGLARLAESSLLERYV